MFSKIVHQLMVPSLTRLLSSKPPPPPPKRRSIPPSLRFYLDTKSVFGPQRTIQTKRATTPSEFDLSPIYPRRTLFEKETELLYGTSEGFYRAGSLPKGIPISEQSRYLRRLFRIPRGQPASQFPQAYISNKSLGIQRKKNK